MRPTAFLPLVLLAGCVANPVAERPKPMPVRGHVDGMEHPEHAWIELYRMTDRGVAVRMHGAEVRPLTDGSFATTPLRPARYLFALRAPDRPVSTITVPVPPAPPARLVARDPLGAASIQLRHDVPGVEELTVLLSTTEDDAPVTDRRRVAVRTGVTSLVRGLGPGRWRLDVVGTGATTEIDVPDTAETLTFTVSPPQVGSAAEMMGRVFRADGAPAEGVAVTLHPLDEGTRQAASWGRYALTDSDGGYRLAGLTAGPARLRVESRDAVHRRLPRPEVVTIPPSGVVRRSFVIEP